MHLLQRILVAEHERSVGPGRLQNAGRWVRFQILEVFLRKPHQAAVVQIARRSYKDVRRRVELPVVTLDFVAIEGADRSLGA